MRTPQWWENLAIRFMHPELFEARDADIRKVLGEPKSGPKAVQQARYSALALEHDRDEAA